MPIRLLLMLTQFLLSACAVIDSNPIVNLQGSEQNQYPSDAHTSGNALARFSTR